jgi:3-deoxy-D-manno-octulosonic-acid transferase
MVSSTTDTGIDAARKRYAPDHRVFRFPKDFSLAVDRAIRRVRPSLVVLIEGDVWPNFLSACNRREVPVVVVNGRMSPDKGYPRYRKLGTLSARLIFNRLAAIGVQDEHYGELFEALGTAPRRVHVTGMIKYDTVDLAGPGDEPDPLPGQGDLAAAIGLAVGQRLLVAGGTGPGEEELLLKAYRRLRERFADLRLALVPRKPERFDGVARGIESAGLPVVRRSRCCPGSPAPPTRDAVILGDTMGELRTFYALSEVVFVGRSLVPMGGSDMIEAAALGKPVAFGPHTFNFPQADDLATNGCVRVADVDELVRCFGDWLADPSAACAAGRAARAFVRSQQGATRRNVEMICRVLGRVPAINEHTIATDPLPEPA